MTSLTLQQALAALREPLPAAAIEWRVGSTTKDKAKGQALPYLTAHAVAERLDELLGPMNWATAYVPGPAGGVVCRLSIRGPDGTWVTKENGAENTEIEGVKGGLTDAFKRAAAIWGIGRYLYTYSPQWVELKDGKYLTKTPTLPAAYLPKAAAPVTSAAAVAPAAKPAAAAPVVAPAVVVHVDVPDLPDNVPVVEEPGPAKWADDLPADPMELELGGKPTGVPAMTEAERKLADQLLAKRKGGTALAPMLQYLDTKAKCSPLVAAWLKSELQAIDVSSFADEVPQ
jgi:hypothetical protein